MDEIKNTASDAVSVANELDGNSAGQNVETPAVNELEEISGFSNRPLDDIERDFLKGTGVNDTETLSGAGETAVAQNDPPSVAPVPDDDVTNIAQGSDSDGTALNAAQEQNPDAQPYSDMDTGSSPDDSQQSSIETQSGESIGSNNADNSHDTGSHVHGVEEWEELAKVHPEVIGNKLPDDVFRAIIASERSALQVYESAMLKRAQDQVAGLQAQVTKLQHDLNNARRAPVYPAANSAASTKAKDPILDAFNHYFEQ